MPRANPGNVQNHWLELQRKVDALFPPGYILPIFLR